MAFEDADRTRLMFSRLHKMEDLKSFAKSLGGINFDNDEEFLLLANMWWENRYSEDYKRAVRAHTESLKKIDESLLLENSKKFYKELVVERLKDADGSLLERDQD
jgi:hypothetical protein